MSITARRGESGQSHYLQPMKSDGTAFSRVELETATINDVRQLWRRDQLAKSLGVSADDTTLVLKSHSLDLARYTAGKTLIIGDEPMTIVSAKRTDDLAEVVVTRGGTRYAHAVNTAVYLVHASANTWVQYDSSRGMLRLDVDPAQTDRAGDYELHILMDTTNTVTAGTEVSHVRNFQQAGFTKGARLQFRVRGEQ